MPRLTIECVAVVWAFLLTGSAALHANGQPNGGAIQNQNHGPVGFGDLSSFRGIAEDTLRIVNAAGPLAARKRAKDLESAWDAAEDNLRPRNREYWRTIDKAIDAALAELRAAKPDAAACSESLNNLVSLLTPSSNGRSAFEAEAASSASQVAKPPKVSVAEAISLAAAREEGSTVLDISFEPESGQPRYQVRTYKDGHVWDGTMDATTGKLIGEGKATEESALDDEDKAELSGLKTTRTTLLEAVAAAESQSAGSARAISAGLEEVKGRVLFEVVVQSGADTRKMFVDPGTGKTASVTNTP